MDWDDLEEDSSPSMVQMSIILGLLVIAAGLSFHTMDAKEWAHSDLEIEWLGSDLKMEFNIGLEEVEVYSEREYEGEKDIHTESMPLEEMADNYLKEGDEDRTIMIDFPSLKGAGEVAGMFLLAGLLATVTAIPLTVTAFLNQGRGWRKAAVFSSACSGALILTSAISWYMMSGEFGINPLSDLVTMMDESDSGIDQTPLASSSSFTLTIVAGILACCAPIMTMVSLRDEDLNITPSIFQSREDGFSTSNSIAQSSVFLVSLMILLVIFQVPAMSMMIPDERSDLSIESDEESGDDEEPEMVDYYVIREWWPEYEEVVVDQEVIQDGDTESVYLETTNLYSDYLYSTVRVMGYAHCVDDTGDQGDSNPNDEVDRLHVTLLAPNGEEETMTIDCDDTWYAVSVQFSHERIDANTPMTEEEVDQIMDDFEFDDRYMGRFTLEVNSETEGDLGGSGLNKDSRSEYSAGFYVRSYAIYESYIGPYPEGYFD